MDDYNNEKKIHRFSKTDEKEVRHSFNICDDKGPLPDPDVPGFSTAVDELSGDFKQLTTMLLTVRFLLEFEVP